MMKPNFAFEIFWPLVMPLLTNFHPLILLIYVESCSFKISNSFLFFHFFMLPRHTNIKVTKALSKQEGPNVYWDARFLNPFFEF